MRIPVFAVDLGELRDLRIDRVQRRVIATVAGVLTGSAVALTFVQFSAARQKRARQGLSGVAPSSAPRMRVAA